MNNISDTAPFSSALYEKAHSLLTQAQNLHLRIATAESCTGGLLSALLTAVPGFSDVIEGGVVTYSNAAKNFVINVPEELIAEFGAVSKPVACAMTEGMLKNWPTIDVAVSITGLAGPGGGSDKKPVGLVHFATSRRNYETLHIVHRFDDSNRAAVRLHAVSAALDLLEKALNLTNSD